MGAGVIGLSAARALAQDGFVVTVYERDRIGSPLGSSPGRSRIYRRTYRHADYLKLALRAIAEWRRLDPCPLRETGLLEYGQGVELHAAAFDEVGQPYEWLHPAEAERRFPEARFPEPALWDKHAGTIVADEALATLSRGLDVREGTAVEDPRELEADVVVACPGSWLGPMFDLPLQPRIEQVTYFTGAPEDRPAIIDHGGLDRRLHYGLVTPGVGYKVAEDAARPGLWDPDRPDRPVDAAVEARLVEHVKRMFPGFDPRPVRSEACLYTMSPDGDFVLDRIDGVIVCGGCSGHAFKFGPLLGRLAADLAQGRPLPPEAARFRTSRLAPA
ncbi:MAG TPA: FAD-dependent oxidoreductase [Gaiellales bacterium]|nr:FAD-dependent oxidoreductase [Gaiellales bacterium]